jgi:predicted ATPase
MCDVSLGALTFLVGPNGSGKSNFLDALRLISESLRTSLEHALRDRGGISEVRRRSGGHPTHFGVRIDFSLADGQSGWFGFRVGAAKAGGYTVQREECRVGNSYYVVEEGQHSRSSSPLLPPATKDRLFLVAAAGLPEYRPAYDALFAMSFFNPVPDVVRTPQPPDPGLTLHRDGRNLASIFERLSKTNPEAKGRVEQYLSLVVPGLRGVETVRVFGLETLEFRQEVAGQQDPWRFKASNMSDGTLRAFGVLVALFQSGDEATGLPLIGLEEPEMALHPAAAGVLLDAVQDASEQRQVLVTTHSPDLLDNPKLNTDELLAVVLEQGQTRIGPVDLAGRAALQEHLYTAGELLRLDQLAPDLDTQPVAVALFD